MKKKLIFLAIVVSIISILGIIFIKIENNKLKNVNLIPPIINERVVYNINSTTSYNTVKSIITKYYQDYKTLLDEDEDLHELGASRLYDSLDDEYIDYSNITKENIADRIIDIKNAKISIENILWYQDGRTRTYIVKVNVRNTETNKCVQKGFVVLTDQENLTYSLYLDDYFRENGYDKIIVGQNVLTNSKQVIEKKDGNSYKIEINDTTTYLKDVYDDIRNYILYDREKAYSMLYSKQFKNYDKFNEFVEENYKSIFIMTLKRYNYSTKDNIHIYTCKDNYKNIELIIYANGYNDIKFEIYKK